MNTSQFMDKQIMDLSSSIQNSKDFIDLMNQPPQQDDEEEDNNSSTSGVNGRKEEILPSYDFQPLRPLVNPDVASTANLGARPWNSSDSKLNSAASPIRNYGSMDSLEPANLILDKDRNLSEATIVSEIDRTVKKYADNLLHVLEGVSARLVQLESRTRSLENSVDDLKVSVGNNYGSTDGKMRQLENILREVQSGVQDLKDKQEIVEAQRRLSKLQVSKADQKSETQSTVQQVAYATLQSHQQLPPHGTFHQPLPPPPPPNAPPPPPSQTNPPPPVQLPIHFPQNQAPSLPQQEPYFPPPAQTQEVPNQQFLAPPAQQPQLPPAAPPHQPYQPAPQQQYSQPPQPPQQHPSLALPSVNPPQPQPSLGHHPEEAPYIPSQTYPPSLRQPPSGPPPSQQYYGPPSSMYEPSSRPSSGFSGGYGSPTGPTEPYPYGGPTSQYGSGTNMKPQQLSSPAMAQSGGSNYPQLPTARILPQAIPTTSAAGGGGGGSGSSGAGNRVPIDDVVDKVTSMGFPRDHVRATVRKLTENGQAVDLNIVLDKLMNDGEVQAPRGWFGR
ncbi:DUF1421 domain-containing protein [Cephalotus follicularis]|uniref:DUF1421 domain-containing protein n=1 Tax=Cephalotus follicularis TaxID=3775 RepID=A0A1Q3BQA9_CEPFO|nr:DUF1421 domain-containing protein [Cephalotus follicularis]